MSNWIEQFKNGEFVINCQTVQQAEEFAKICDENGIGWGTGKKLPDELNYANHGNLTTYNYEGKGVYYCHVDWYAKRGYKVVKYSDLVKVIKEKKKEVVKEITYHQVLQPFTEIDAKTGKVIKQTAFKLKEKKEKVIHSGNVTVVILDDGSKGKAKCLEQDEYSELKGIKIAYLKAKIKSLQKELKKLSK